MGKEKETHQGYKGKSLEVLKKFNIRIKANNPSNEHIRVLVDGVSV